MINRQGVIIVGAGLAGLSAGMFLRGRKKEFLILEKEAEPGGLCRSRHVRGFTFDYDGHLLHFRTQRGLALVKALLPGMLKKHVRNAWIHCCGVDVPYPFQANLYALPEKIRKECLRGFKRRESVQGRSCPGEQTSFSDWLSLKFGRGINKYFMLPYNRKFWRYPLAKMTDAWTRDFIPQLSSERVVSGSADELRDKLGYNSVFWYPDSGGINILPEKIAAKAGSVLLDKAVCAIDLERRILRTGTGEEYSYQQLISTMPLPEFGRICGELPSVVKRAFRSLKWNSILVFNFGICGGSYPSRHWVYFPESKFVFFRVGFPHAFSADSVPAGKRSLYAEVSYLPGAKRAPISVLKNKVLQSLRKSGVLGARDKICVSEVMSIKYAYPIYDYAYSQARRLISDYLLKKGVILCGRYGAWRYLSMEDCLLDGIDAAERACAYV